MENGMWPAYESSSFLFDRSNGEHNSVAEEVGRKGSTSADKSFLLSQEAQPLTIGCRHLRDSCSLPSDNSACVNSTYVEPHNDLNFEDNWRSNCRSCPIFSDLERRCSFLESHSLQHDNIPYDFKRMKSDCERCSSPAIIRDNFAQSLPNLCPLLSTVGIISDSPTLAYVSRNTVNVANSNHRIDELPSGNCNDDSSSSEPTTNVCCEWIRNTTRQEKLILFCLFLVDFTSQMCLSIMAPFFPQEAENKGVSNSVSGWIFGVFALTQFISSPIFGKLLPIVGSRFLITAGQFFSSGCIILFGVLDYIEPQQEDVFISLCFVLRIALAIGCTAASTASFTVTAVCFPNSISTIFGLLETATGMGMMLGPALGGFLNQTGGFMLSFAVLGGLMLVTVPLNYYCLPANDAMPSRSGAVSLRQMLQIPAVIVINLGVVMAACVWSILDPTLSVSLSNDFQLNSIMMGLLFLLMSCVYAVSAPVWGRLADFMDDSLPLMVGGFLLSGIGLMLLGPSPFFNVEGEMWLVILSLIVLGASVSLALVPTFDKILDVTEKAGFKDDLSVYGFVAGIWGASFAFGDFIGPAVGGWLMDSKGFGWTMTYVAFACYAMAVIILGLILYEKRFQKRESLKKVYTTSDVPSDEASDAGTSTSETTPLINPDNNRTATGSCSGSTNRLIPEVTV